MADGSRCAGGRGASDLLWVDDSTRDAGARRGGLPDPRPGADRPRPPARPTPIAPDPAAAARPQRDPAEARAAAEAAHAARDWDANDKWRNGKPHYIDQLKQVHIHHTATGNDYARRDVPGILRGMYRYHTKTLGWFDIGYNFLVDRFGRAWIGRSGGANKLVRGAHTLGFNNSSVGIALIGNLEDRSPGREALTTLVKLAAWKLDKHDREARGKVTVRSSGSDKYAEDERVRLPVIDGHRDANDTACPGERLYAKLPEIRRRTQWRINHWGEAERQLPAVVAAVVVATTAAVTAAVAAEMASRPPWRPTRPGRSPWPACGPGWRAGRPGRRPCVRGRWPTAARSGRRCAARAGRPGRAPP